jgi:hypothetical protein
MAPDLVHSLRGLRNSGRIAPLVLFNRAGIPLKIAARVDEADREYFQQGIQPLLGPPLIGFIGEINETEKSPFSATPLPFSSRSIGQSPSAFSSDRGHVGRDSGQGFPQSFGGRSDRWWPAGAIIGWLQRSAFNATHE